MDHRFRRLLIAIILSLVSTYVVLLYVDRLKDSSKIVEWILKEKSNDIFFLADDKVVKSNSTFKKGNLNYIFYNSDFFNIKWGLGYGEEPFKRCKYRNCYLLKDTSTNIPKDKYAAGIFHVRNNCGQKEFERIKAIRKSISGPFIFFIQESEFHDCNINLRPYNDIFNWTMDFHPDADINIVNGNTYKVAKTEGLPQFDVKQVMRKKMKLAFWVVSHKGAQSQRDIYAEALKKYISFDQFGSYSAKKCPTAQDKNGTVIDCKTLLAPTYKFYFAFENSVCDNYITEKFFQALNLPVVPVVYGKGNYTAYSPPHSFIDVRDFKGPKELAEYLLYLDKNETAYTEYFKWKEDGTYKVSENKEENERSVCALCNKLNNLEYKKAYTSEELILHWRGKTGMCSNPFDYIPGLREVVMKKS